VLISHKSTFLVDCSGLFGPFWGSKVSLIVVFLKIFFGHFWHEKNHFSISEPPFLTILLRITDRWWRESMWMLAWAQSCMLIQKRYVLSAFFAFLLLMNIDSLFLIQILTFSFPFFKQIHSDRFQEELQEKPQVHRLPSSPASWVLAKDHHGRRPGLLRRSHFFSVAQLLVGYGWYCDISKCCLKRCFQKPNIGFWLSVPTSLNIIITIVIEYIKLAFVAIIVDLAIVIVNPVDSKLGHPLGQF